jgi:murein DD-endopeptidase MepM/ murein hydrolase activator NlpD
MSKINRKRYLSLIYVPDQDADPKSVSMSYAKGRILAFLLALLGLHILWGFFGYYRVARLESQRRSLIRENADLKVSNRRIDEIEKEFARIKRTDEKIRKAFGVTLGVGEQPARGAEPDRAVSARTQAETAVVAEEPAGAVKAVDNAPLILVSRREAADFNPEDLPTRLPVNGVMTTRYRESGTQARRNHRGIDIAAPKGTVIQAAGSGVVLFSDWTPDLGNLVIVSHGMGYMTYYAHAQKSLVEQGMRVKKGQPIALVGSSGISSAPHLHFELWKDGESINPEEFLYAAQRERTGAND